MPFPSPHSPHTGSLHFVTWPWLSILRIPCSQSLVFNMHPFAMLWPFLVSLLSLSGVADGLFFPAGDAPRGGNKRVPHGAVHQTPPRHASHGNLGSAWVHVAHEKLRMMNADLRGVQGRVATLETTEPTPSDIEDAREAEAASSTAPEMFTEIFTETDNKKSCAVILRDQQQQQQQKQDTKTDDAKLPQIFRMLAGGVNRALTPGSLSPANRMATGIFEPTASGDRKKIKAAARAGTIVRGGGGGGEGGSMPPSNKLPSTGLTNALEGFKNGLASGLAAACVKTVLQPFDTMKTVQQYSTAK